jgi:hypothetical protein
VDLMRELPDDAVLLRIFFGEDQGDAGMAE